METGLSSCCCSWGKDFKNKTTLSQVPVSPTGHLGTKANEERLVLWSLWLGSCTGHASDSAPRRQDTAPAGRPGEAGLLVFRSDSCSSVTCRIMSNSSFHVAEPVLPLIPFTFVLSLEECLGMIHTVTWGRQSSVLLPHPASSFWEIT